MQREYFGHRDGVWEVSVGRSGQIIATASADHSARVWAVDSGRCLLQYIGTFLLQIMSLRSESDGLLANLFMCLQLQTQISLINTRLNLFER